MKVAVWMQCEYIIVIYSIISFKPIRSLLDRFKGILPSPFTIKPYTNNPVPSITYIMPRYLLSHKSWLTNKVKRSKKKEQKLPYWHLSPAYVSGQWHLPTPSSSRKHIPPLSQSMPWHSNGLAEKWWRVIKCIRPQSDAYVHDDHTDQYKEIDTHRCHNWFQWIEMDRCIHSHCRCFYKCRH